MQSSCSSGSPISSSACPPRLPSGGSSSKASNSSGESSSRNRPRSSSIGDRVAFCMDKLKRAVTPERLRRSRSREVSPVSVTVRPCAEGCWQEDCLMDSPIRRTAQQAQEDLPARFRRSNSLAELLQEDQTKGESIEPVCCEQRGLGHDEVQPPGMVMQTDGLPQSSATEPAVPQGGVSLSINFCSPGAKSRGPPPAVLARLSRPPRNPSSSNAAMPEAPAQERARQTSGHPQGGVALDIDFGGSAAKAKGPPPAVLARLSKGSAGRRPAEKEGSVRSQQQRQGNPQRMQRGKNPRIGSGLAFLEAAVPAEFLAEHDTLDLDDPLRSHVLTTPFLQSLCTDLHALNPEGVRALLAWRAALCHERSTGEVPSEAQVTWLATCEAEAQKSLNMARVAGSLADVFSAGPNVTETSGANLHQQVHGVGVAMQEAFQARAGEEDNDVINQLTKEIEKLNQSLKEPGLTSAQSYAIRKQLGARRSEKARAERAVRQGRKAKLEISSGDAAVQAIVDGLPTAARGSRQLGQSYPISCDFPDGPPRAQHVRTPEGQNCEVLASALPPGFAKTERPPAAGSIALTLAVLLHPETLSAAGSSAIGRLGMAAKEFKAVALDCADLSFGDTAWRCASQAFAHEHALWCPKPLKSGQQGYWHKLMFEQLWPARAKWEGINAPAPRRMGEMGVASETTSRDFKIQVSIRFKPGSTKEGRLLVPLHQKLVLLRKSGVDIGSKIGNKEPPEFLDALMGHVMADPVRLPSSGKVCDRCVVQEQLRSRDSRDPFDGSPLTIDMLEPQDELRQRIVDWKAESKRRVGDGGEEHKLDDKEVRELISELGGDLDPEIVEMLLEADQLRAAGKRALKDSSSRRKWNAGEEEIADEEAEETEELEGQAWWDEDVQNLGAGRAAMPVAGQRVIDGRGMQEAAEEELGEAPTREGPKVLAVSPPTRVVMFQPGAGIRPFVFARVFDERASQEDVYENTARSSVCAALNGFNACLLCYGQTGSGKTHTMFGQSVACGGNAGAVVSQQSGSVMRSLRELFNAAAELEVSCGVVTQISVQYVQIYQDQVTCLVTGAVVALREAVAGAPVLLQGATETPLESLVDASQLIANGEERKRYAETAMNHRSSRAHTVLAVKLSQRRGDLETTSQLHLVDLAGSERVKKSRAQGGRLIEAVGINSSLMVLGQCIKARVEDRNHVPYYESRLTLLLRSALGGNSRTAVVICCHKEDKHGDETLQALSFGERCAMVSNRVHAAMASSASEAAAAIDAALAECGRQIQGLEIRGKGHLPACDKLRKRHATLSRRRRELGGKVGATEAVETEGSAESQ